MVPLVWRVTLLTRLLRCLTDRLILEASVPLYEIRVLSTKFNVVFQHELRSANTMANALANRGRIELFLRRWEGLIL